jgi:hypothetical protein
MNPYCNKTTGDIVMVTTGHVYRFCSVECITPSQWAHYNQIAVQAGLVAQCQHCHNVIDNKPMIVTRYDGQSGGVFCESCIEQYVVPWEQ